MFNTLIPLSRELWPMIDSVMPFFHCPAVVHITAPVQLATRYTTPNTIVKTGTTSVTVE